MAYVYDIIDGQRVEWHVAIAFRALDAAFFKETGCRLKITWGTRTRAEQTKIFLERYVRAKDIRGRKVYDTQVWNGVIWYRVSPAGRVATPGFSNHEEDGPNGPRSLDLRDTGRDPGVTTFGTKRNAVLQRLCPKHGFENEGNKFNEAWHKTYRGTIGGPRPKPSGGGDQPFQKGDIVLNHYTRDDGTARTPAGRIVKPGSGCYLHTTAGVATSQATNIVGGVGFYQFAIHIYAEGTPGDVVTVNLMWQDTRTRPTKNSDHFIERIEIPASGKVATQFPFERSVTSGFAVYVKVLTPSTNKGDIKITRLFSDAARYATA